MVDSGNLRLRLFGLAISLVALWVVVRSVDLGAAIDQVARANPAYLVVCLGAIAMQVGLRSVRWRLLLPRRDGHPIPLYRIPPVLLVGYLGNAVLPARLGEPIRAYLIARRERVGALECFGSVVLERIVDTATLAVVAFVAAVAVGAPEWITRATAFVAIVCTVLIVGIVAIGVAPFVRFGRQVTGRLPFLGRFEPLLTRLDDFARGLDRPSRSAAIVVAVGVSGVCWMLDASIFWLVAQSIGVNVSFAAALLVAAVTVLGTALPSAPGYVGTFELAASATAQTLGVAAAPAFALAILAHAMTVLPSAFAGGVSLAAMDVSLGRLAADATDAENRPMPAEVPS